MLDLYGKVGAISLLETRRATRSVYLVGLLAAPPRGITGLGSVDAVGPSFTTIRSGCLTIIVSAPPSLAFPLGHLLVVACHGIAGRRLHVPIVGSFVTVARSFVAPCRPGTQGIADAIWIEAQLGGTLDEGRNVRWGALLRSVHAERLPANLRAQTYGSLSSARSLSAKASTANDHFPKSGRRGLAKPVDWSSVRAVSSIGRARDFSDGAPVGKPLVCRQLFAGTP